MNSPISDDDIEAEEVDPRFALHVWPRDRFEAWKDDCGSAAYEATHYGGLLLDNLEEAAPR